MKPNYIQQSQNIYNLAEPEYERYYYNTEVDIADINKGITRAMVWDTERLLQKIALIFNDGKVQELTREELDNGESFQ
ncbi:MAG: hypothetical protein HC789_21125 [Microcoleus sp. CSU_2_2]|nr:hypothetical protein [Microcoleus sp. CSU_2_2]